jgi:hypothetical protein
MAAANPGAEFNMQTGSMTPFDSSGAQLERERLDETKNYHQGITRRSEEELNFKRGENERTLSKEGYSRRSDLIKKKLSYYEGVAQQMMAAAAKRGETSIPLDAETYALHPIPKEKRNLTWKELNQQIIGLHNLLEDISQ